MKQASQMCEYIDRDNNRCKATARKVAELTGGDYGLCDEHYKIVWGLIYNTDIITSTYGHYGLPSTKGEKE